MSEYPDIKRGTRFGDTNARAWQNLTEDVRGPASIQSGPGILITQAGQHWNIRVSDDILQLLLRKPPQAVTGADGLVTGMFRFRRMRDDYFEAYKLGDDGEPIVGEDGERLVFNVAKPFDLRKTPFHNKDIQWLNFPAVIRYVYTSGYVREAMRRDTGATFIERIWKPYHDPLTVANPPEVIYQWIWADKVGAAKTGIKDDADNPIVWLDRNQSGRLWVEFPE